MRTGRSRLSRRMENGHSSRWEQTGAKENFFSHYRMLKKHKFCNPVMKPFQNIDSPSPPRIVENISMPERVYLSLTPRSLAIILPFNRKGSIFSEALRQKPILLPK